MKKLIISALCTCLVFSAATKAAASSYIPADESAAEGSYITADESATEEPYITADGSAAEGPYITADESPYITGAESPYIPGETSDEKELTVTKINIGGGSTALLISSPGAEASKPADFALSPNRLLLVNFETPIPQSYSAQLVNIGGGHKMDKTAAGHLAEMLSDARKAGLSPVVVSSYRTNKKQQSLFTRQINRHTGRGLTYDEAFDVARTVVAYPGTSEHELGLAVDIVAKSYQGLDTKQEETDETKWLMENCKNYGFILRYPQDKSEITEIIYEPWHYRYVGVEAAEIITENNLCLEEYIELIAAGEANDEGTVHAYNGYNAKQRTGAGEKY
jgi:D-alanyl-D-alanine carboxypeptidase